jgi:hypothetical protein
MMHDRAPEGFGAGKHDRQDTTVLLQLPHDPIKQTSCRHLQAAVGFAKLSSETGPRLSPVRCVAKAFSRS